MPARNARSGFSLLELLIVVAILIILIAILLAVFARARGAAHRAACQSNLRQLGAAFRMYAIDFDGRFPNPGGREVSGGPTNGAAWYSAARDPVTDEVIDTGAGIFPYVLERRNAPQNLWSCPNALPGHGNRRFDVGQNYAMNDYLRGRHPGQAVTALGSVSVSFLPGFHTGIDVAHIEAASSDLILLFEVVQSEAGGCNRNGSVYFSTPALGGVGSRYGAGGLPIGAPEEYHAGGSNFLFADGRVAFMRPTRTWTPATQPAVEEYNTAYLNAAPAAPRRGAGRRDLWNPGLGAVVYP